MILWLLLLFVSVKQVDAQQYFEGVVISESWMKWNEPLNAPEMQPTVEVRSQPDFIYPLETGRLKVEMRISPHHMRRLAYGRGNEVPSSDRIIDFETGYVIDIDHQNKTYHILSKDGSYPYDSGSVPRTVCTLTDSGSTVEYAWAESNPQRETGFSQRAGMSASADSLLGLSCRQVEIWVETTPAKLQRFEILNTYTHAYPPVYIPERFAWFEPEMASLRDAFTLYREIRTNPYSRKEGYRIYMYGQVISVEQKGMGTEEFAIPEGYREAEPE